MVNLLTGQKGSGKTQQMIERANEAVKTCEGNVFFIKKSHRDTYSLSFNIRAICMDDYDVITNTDEYLGFIYGMLSADHDIKAIYIIFFGNLFQCFDERRNVLKCDVGVL